MAEVGLFFFSRSKCMTGGRDLRERKSTTLQTYSGPPVSPAAASSWQGGSLRGARPRGAQAASARRHRWHPRPPPASRPGSRRGRAEPTTDGGAPSSAQPGWPHSRTAASQHPLEIARLIPPATNLKPKHNEPAAPR